MTPTEQRIFDYIMNTDLKAASENELQRQLGVSHGSIYNAITHGVIYRDGSMFKPVIKKESTKSTGKPIGKRERVPLVSGSYESTDGWEYDMRTSTTKELVFQYGLDGVSTCTVIMADTGEEVIFDIKPYGGSVHISCR